MLFTQSWWLWSQGLACWEIRNHSNCGSTGAFNLSCIQFVTSCDWRESILIVIIKQTLWKCGLEAISENQAQTATAHNNYWELTFLFSAKDFKLKNEKNNRVLLKKSIQPSPLSKCLNVDENTAFWFIFIRKWVYFATLCALCMQWDCARKDFFSKDFECVGHSIILTKD